MLRNVLDDYLERVKEREFDLPLLLLLPVLGYYDVHLTHGPVEFGRDVIAKRREGDNEVQFSFQSKAGDITQSAWRNEIRGQIETALWSSLSHPNFNRNLPHQVVLLTTGDLKGNAAIEFQEFNDTIKDRYQRRPVIFWSKLKLIELLLEHGLNGIYRATAAGFGEFGRFFELYSRALQRVITVRDIEVYSRQWTSAAVDRERRLLLSAVEAEVLAQCCLEGDLVYEAAQLHLARLRLLCEFSYGENGEELRKLWDRGIERLYALCASYVDQISETWIVERDLVKTWFGEVYMTTYPVQCARIMEMASLAYFSAPGGEDKERHAAFIRRFVRAEPGCTHPISDRFAISIVLVSLVLIDWKLLDDVAQLLEKATVWICDRYEDGMGLPGVEADEQAETNRLLGYPFDFIPVPRRHDSLLATAVMDLSAFLGNADLFRDIVNDIKACRIHAEYWQPSDTIGACRIEGRDILHFPSVGFADALDEENKDYAEHIASDSGSFRFVELFGPESAVVVMALLRDRYFPALWQQIASNHQMGSHSTATPNQERKDVGDYIQLAGDHEDAKEIKDQLNP